MDTVGYRSTHRAAQTARQPGASNDCSSYRDLQYA
jgi:hypothetical protein